MSEPLILVPLNGSKQALAALPVAKVLGEIERAAVQILHVGEHELPVCRREGIGKVCGHRLLARHPDVLPLAVEEDAFRPTRP